VQLPWIPSKSRGAVLSLAEGAAIAMSSLTGPEASTLCARFGRANWRNQPKNGVVQRTQESSALQRLDRPGMGLVM
jgi:hypothetical protein